MDVKKIVPAGTVAMMLSTSAAAAPSLEELYEIIQRQQAQIEALQKQVSSQKQQSAVLEERIEQTADVAEQAAEGGKDSLFAKTSLGGYGEHHFNRFKENKEKNRDQIDAHRFVVFLGHEFTDDVRMFSEIELEHSLAGDGKPGEVELEQAYIEWDYAKNHRVKFGQFLIPVGILNETHEPDTFYGTERNNVEKNIIPTTWWESGVMMSGAIAPGLSYDAGVHGGLAVPDASGSKPWTVRSGRQKSAEAIAEDLAYTARLKYTGIQGLELAATGHYQAEITQGAAVDDADATLLSAHAAYQSGPFGLRTLYAQWDIDGDDFDAAGADKQTGWYFEPSYKVLPKLGLFARYSQWDTRAGNSDDTEVEQIDWGLNFWLVDNVVLKADWSDTRNSSKDAFNLGVGWSF